MVHQGFNYFSKCSLRFFSQELKYSSSCIPKCNSFISHLLRWCYVIVDNFPSCFMIHKSSKMRYFKSINLFIRVILGYISPKTFPKECCYLWCLSMIQISSYSRDERCFHLSVAPKQAIFFVCGRFSPQVLEMFSLSPQQAYSFVVGFPNNSVQSFFLRMLSQIHLRQNMLFFFSVLFFAFFHFFRRH